DGCRHVDRHWAPTLPARNHTHVASPRIHPERQNRERYVLIDTDVLIGDLEGTTVRRRWSLELTNSNPACSYIVRVLSKSRATTSAREIIRSGASRSRRPSAESGEHGRLTSLGCPHRRREALLRHPQQRRRLDR